MGPLIFDNGHGSCPSSRSSPYLHREAGNHEPLRGELLQIMQLLQVTIADGPSSSVAFPDYS